jgi:DNA-binding CsgD family transcriptional regulator
MVETAPAIVAADAAAMQEYEESRRREGWTVTPSWELPDEPFDLRSRRHACAATVSSPEDVAAAVLAAVRGANVIAECADTELAVLLVDDLRRVTTVEQAGGASSDVLDDEQQRLLDLLAGGATINEAATALYLSVRTAERRLAASRRALGVRTTAEAVRISSEAPGRPDTDTR